MYFFPVCTTNSFYGNKGNSLFSNDGYILVIYVA